MSKKHAGFSVTRQVILLLFTVLFFFSPVRAQNFEVNVSTSKGSVLPGVKIYAFTESGSYTGRNATTDGNGTAIFDPADFADGAYKFRVDYLGNRFWSQVVAIPGAFAVEVAIEEETVDVTVAMAAGPVAGVRVYLFSEGGSYLGLYQITDGEGMIYLDLPVGRSFKFRADILEGHYWSEIITVWGGGGNSASVAAGGGLFNVTLKKGSGLPMPGIKVYLFSQSGSYLGLHGVTDENGVLSFQVPEGAFKVRADYLGYKFWSEETHVMTDSHTTVLIPHQPVEITVAGLFQGASEPVSGIRVYLFSSGGSYMGQYQQTDAGGKVSFDLPEKAYKIRADYMGQQFWSDAFTWQETTVNVPMADIDITVTGAGLPQQGVKVYVFSSAGSYLGVYESTDHEGKVFFHIPEGVYKFRADYLGSQYWSSDASIARDELNHINISTGGGAFTVAVHNDADDAFTGVRCYVFNASGSYLGLFDATDNNGGVSFDLADGTYKFRVDYLGGRFWSGLTSIPDVSSTEVVIAEETVEVTVQTAAGPAAGIKVYLFSEGGSYLGLFKVTDENGLVSFDLPVGGAFKFRADILGERFWSDIMTVSDGGVNPVSIHGEGGLFHVTVEKASDSPIEGIKVYLFSQNGSYLGLYELTDDAGGAGFHVPDGNFKVRGDYLGYQFWSDETLVTEDKSIVLTIPHQPNGVTVAGVFQGTSEPIGGIKTYLFSPAGSYVGQYQMTDADGKASFDLPEKAYKIRADYMGQQFWSDAFTWSETVINVPMADAVVTVTEAGIPQQGVKVYVFSDAGSYLGAYQITDEDGRVRFRIPAGVYKFRADKGGNQYWSQASAMAPDLENHVAIGIGGTPVTASISADPETIGMGESTLISWSSTNAVTAHMDNGIGVIPVDGSLSVSPEHTTTYTVTATGAAGSANAKITVMVTGEPEPQPEGSFGEQYETLTPTDATIEEYDPKRFSVITGRVLGIDDSPIDDVSVTLHGHPEYGTAATDAEGRFSIPVEGGGTLTVLYHKEGLIPSQRQVHVPWNDIAVCETIQMIEQDPEATTLTFDGSSTTVITHESSNVTDEFGNRSCSLVFQGNNRAYAVDDDGNEMFELDTINVRATEFSAKDAMPARLPPNSAYTYCVELSVDGVKNVVFEDPVVTWVNNFLGFDVGIAVPVGYYDRAKGIWVPLDNGVVVRLLDENNDGRVDALDADGDDLPDDLNRNGTYDDEVTGLDDPSRYLPGDTFWRVAVPHFSPFDFNWPYGPDGDAESPNPDGVPDADQSSSEKQSCPTSVGSFVEDRSRILHEDISIPGTDMTLHYASSRVEGYKTIINVPASGDTVPESLKRIVVEVDVAGRKFTRELAPLPNQMAEISWDGLDFRRHRVSSTIPAQVRLGFVYDAVYYSPGNFDQAFGKYGCSNYECPMSTVRARQEVFLWQNHEITIREESIDYSGLMGEGWTLSVHHSLDPVYPDVLHKGNGTTTDSRIKIMETVAGNGNIGFDGDGGPAIQASFSYPMGVALDQAGNIFISDTWNHRVRKVDTEGVITTVAGNGLSGYGGDDGLAVDASLSYPWGIAVDSSGNLYIADFGNNCIRRVDTEGVITTVAGNGLSGYGGDDELAVDASLSGPKDVALDEWGNVYIADTKNNRIRKVDPNGIITTAAGDGYGRYGGDGGNAVEASIRNPQGVAVFEGSIFICDTFNSRVRRVDPSGIITTVAGDGTFGYGGDGGPAYDAILNSPTDIVPDKSGNIYIVEISNGRVRKVDTNGNIITVAGNGTQDFVEDGLPATRSPLDAPFSVALDGAGNLFILDEVSARLFRVNALSELPAWIASYIEGEGDGYFFAEEDGMGHIISSSGRHEATVDLETGVALRTFEYNEDHQLISISDPFGNGTIIERTADGTPTAIVNPDGLTTTLTIDAQKHLTAVTYPDDSAYGLEYTEDGLMTAETEPNGNRFEHQFDASGRLTDVLDEEGGHWHFSRMVYENGDVAAQMTSGEGNQTTYWDHAYSTERFTSTIIAADDSETQYERSTDGLTVYKWLPCGMSLGFSYDVDPLYKFKYIGEMVEITPSELSKTTLREKSYQDTDSDGYADLVTETVEVNGKTTLLQQNVLTSNKTVTSPEGRVVTTTYDPDTLLTMAVSISGLFDTAYGYDARGRLTSITNNTRQTAFAYNAQGFLGSVTDPENHTTSYTYDLVGRVTGIHRPDGNSVGFTYDKNGNMTILTVPITVNHDFGYNKVNRKDAYHAPISGTYQYVYDKDRRLISTVFPSGNEINKVYDKARLVQIQTPGGNIDLSYLYASKVGSRTNGTDTITYGYDGKLVTSKDLTGTLNQSLSYTYNNDFRAASFTYAGGSTSIGSGLDI